jgi:hypothetical protein
VGFENNLSPDLYDCLNTHSYFSISGSNRLCGRGGIFMLRVARVSHGYLLVGCMDDFLHFKS